MFVGLFFQLIQVALNGNPIFQLSTSSSSLCHSWTSQSAASDLFPAGLHIIGNYTLILSVQPVLHLFSLCCPNAATRMCKCRRLLCLNLALKNDITFQEHIRCKILFRRAVQLQAMYLSTPFFYNLKIFLYTYPMVAWLIYKCKVGFITFTFFVAYFSSWNFMYVSSLFFRLKVESSLLVSFQQNIWIQKDHWKQGKMPDAGFKRLSSVHWQGT